MVNSIGNGGSFARDAIRAAMQRQAEAQQRLQGAAEELKGQPTEGAEGERFDSKLVEGLREVNAQVELGEQIVEDVLTGKVTEFHEVATQVKQADLTFKFALSVRNKFVDAYREVMRMSV